MKVFCCGLVLSLVVTFSVLADAQSAGGAAQSQPAGGGGCVGCLDRYPVLAPTEPAPSDRQEDWRQRIAAQKQKVEDLQAELVPLEEEYRRLQTECAWKQCQVNAWTEGGAGAAPSDHTPDEKFLALQQQVEAKRAELARAQQKLDSMAQEANQEAWQQ